VGQGPAGGEGEHAGLCGRVVRADECVCEWRWELDGGDELQREWVPVREWGSEGVEWEDGGGGAAVRGGAVGYVGGEHGRVFPVDVWGARGVGGGESGGGGGDAESGDGEEVSGAVWLIGWGGRSEGEGKMGYGVLER